MSKVLGIDLGTTNSAMAIFENGEAKIITKQEGENTKPICGLPLPDYTGADSLVGRTRQKGPRLVTKPRKRTILFH